MRILPFQSLCDNWRIRDLATPSARLHSRQFTVRSFWSVRQPTDYRFFDQPACWLELLRYAENLYRWEFIVLVGLPQASLRVGKAVVRRLTDTPKASRRKRVV